MISSKDCLLGSTFTFKKPTTAVASKHGLNVEEVPMGNYYGYNKREAKTRQIYLVGNRLEYRNEMFGSTVLYLRGAPGESLPPDTEGATFAILDKKRVKNKDTIRHLVGETLVIPFALLSKSGRVLDTSSLPPKILFKILDHVFEDSELVPAAKYGRFTSPIEMIRFARKNAPSSAARGHSRFLIEAALRNQSGIFTSGRPNGFKCKDKSLVCACGTNCSVDVIMTHMQNHTTKKRYVNPYTFTCPYCKHKYKLVSNEDGLRLVTVKKTGNAKVYTKEEWITRRNARWGGNAPARVATRRRRRRARADEEENW